MTTIQGGTNICGVSIGVLALESYFPKPPGHIKNPSSMPFTLSYEVIDGLTVPSLLKNPSNEMIEPLLAAARRLESSGVTAITGACGFLALFQRQIAAAVNVPVCASSLLLAPMIHAMSARPVGVITASKDALTSAHLEAVGAAHVPLEIEGMEHSAEFTEVILVNTRNDMNLGIIEADLLAAGQRLVGRTPEIGAVLLECTDLPPYAAPLQRAIQRPVFDIITLTQMVYAATRRTPFPGFIN